MRCEIGWPIVTLVPGSSETFCRSSSSTASRGRSFISSRTSISADSTPCTCSSNSARPVRRAVEVTSGTLSISRSRALPSALESARLVPGIVTALTVKAPSLNSGRNDLPAATMPTRAATNRATAAVSTVRQYVNAWPSHRSYAVLRRRVNLGSVPDAIRRDFGNSHEHSTGVTVSATTSDAVSATT